MIAFTKPILFVLIAFVIALYPAAADFQRLSYNHPDLIVDLGVGLWVWPVPLDYDGDGDMDLLASCPDQPFNGINFFENPGSGDTMPVFKAGVRLADGARYLHVSYVKGKPRLLVPGREYVDFRANEFKRLEKIYPTSEIHPGSTRANDWYYVDYDGDGDQDLIVGVGVWETYGWDNAYDSNGTWQNDRLHGYVYLLENTGTDENPDYAEKRRIQAGNGDVDVYGWPSPNFADFDGDGDLDLLCGEFLDGFTYFENIGSRTKPEYRAGTPLVHNGERLHMDLQMIVPTAVDWDKDGDVDLIVGQEDGRIAFVEHTGEIVDGVPHFLPPLFFKQQAKYLKFGACSTPVGVDWDADGDEDILCGNTAGHIAFFEHLGGTPLPKWAAPQLLEAAGKTIRIMAGPNGSIQGPCEAKWGYSTPSVADWDHDGLPDLLMNNIWGKILWYRNVGTPEKAKLEDARAIEAQWPGETPKPKWTWWEPEGNALVTQWRTTPVAVDFTGDGLNDLVMLDTEGYLCLYERQKSGNGLVLLPPQRIFVDEDDRPIQLNPKSVGSSGRRKMAVADWDGDGRLDIFVDSKNADWWRNCETRNGNIVLKQVGTLGETVLARHSTSPTFVDWNKDAIPDLLLGAEDGHLYFLSHEDAKTFTAVDTTARPAQETPKEGLLAQPGVVSGTFIFTKAPFRECHASTIAETTAGLIAAWFGGTEEAEQDVSIWASRNKGDGWEPPVEVANGIQENGERVPCWNPVLFQPKDAPLMLFYKAGPDETEWWGMVVLSYDGGRTWQKPQRLPDGILGPIKNKPVQLNDGTILSPSSVEYFKNPPSTDEEVWQIHIERSTDGGLTWEKSNPLNDGTTYNVIQPSVLVYPNGRLQLLCRSMNGYIIETWSEDLGRTWSPLEPTSLPNPDAGTDALVLADGRALLVYNHTKSGRHKLNVALSQDGETWEQALVLENHLGEFSYPAVIQTDDGLVHITYTWKRERIKHVVIDPGVF